MWLFSMEILKRSHLLKDVNTNILESEELPHIKKIFRAACFEVEKVQAYQSLLQNEENFTSQNNHWAQNETDI